ncbi:MAG: hypothetical protein ABIN91_11910 [Mucilaginibacter sp.]|uniref:hypothetical protein n=1 Tax=Mucilaginibacter sp. TaxID=1882438 RepID=UPI003264104F
MKKLAVLLLASIMSSIFSYGKARYKEGIKDYFGITGPITFNKVDYIFSWSSHPVDIYYKQEFLPNGESSDKFKSMILMDFVVGDFKVEDVLSLKVNELKKMKESNPVVNYHIIENKATNEYILDFIVSDNSGGKTNIVERNVYRYKLFTDKNGKKGVLLFGISNRSYGDDIPDFFKKLKTNLNDLVNTVGQFNIPDITIAQN